MKSDIRPATTAARLFVLLLPLLASVSCESTGKPGNRLSIEERAVLERSRKHTKDEPLSVREDGSMALRIAEF